MWLGIVPFYDSGKNLSRELGRILPEHNEYNSNQDLTHSC